MSGLFTITPVSWQYNERETLIMHDANQSKAECIKNNFEFIILPANHKKLYTKKD